MADLVVANPAIKPTTAAKQIIRGIGPSYLRRLQVKWRAMSAELIEAARDRATRNTVAQVGRAGNPLPLSRAGTLAAAWLDYENSPTAKMMRAFENSPTAKMMRAFEYSPTAKMMRAFEDSPTAKMMRAFEDSPTAKMLRAFENSPTAKMMRAFEDSPTAKMVRAFEDCLIASRPPFLR
jgi:hypothetical protein